MNSSLSFIRLIGCREHNLKNISLTLPKYAITVITGMSGSGKSSLAFDTLFAEGQRRYLEYMSTQAHLWIKQMPKPAIDFIEGLSPTLAVSQQNSPLFYRGTVATYTDIYDLFMLLFATIGKQHSPFTGKRLQRYSRQEMIEILLKEYSIGTRIQILAPVALEHETLQEAIIRLQNMGFIRFQMDQHEWTAELDIPSSISSLDVVVDRLEIKEGVRERLATSVETCLDISRGILKIQEGKEKKFRFLTEIFVCPESSYSFAPLSPQDFNFNSPQGACSTCDGKGGHLQIDPDFFIEFSDRPLLTQIQPYLLALPKNIAYSFQLSLDAFSKQYHLTEFTLAQDLSPNVLNNFLYGSSDLFEIFVDLKVQSFFLNSNWQGCIPFFNRLLRDKKAAKKIESVSTIKWFPCETCKGTRLKSESLACLVQGKNISEWCQLSVSSLITKIKEWTFEKNESVFIAEIFPQIEKRLHFLEQVGLGYLELDRSGRTLSDGEAQRIRLASQIGAKLTGLIYILDEPSLGLHARDMDYLQQVIRELQQIGNTVILVEHQRKLIMQADYLVELGPGAGKQGGQLVFEGTVPELLKNSDSLTAQWLSHKKQFTTPPPYTLASCKHFLTIEKISLHNLKNFSIKIPLGCLVGFCGVSGSGKSTLVTTIIGTHFQHVLHRSSYDSPFIQGGEFFKKIVLGKKLSTKLSSRSMPATYTGIMTPLRQLYASTRLAQARGYTAARFSLNKKGGRCEACEGLGEKRIPMQLMADLFVPCEICQGKRYNYETLQILWENRSLADVLELTIEEAKKVFQFIPTLYPTLELMQELGLGYLCLGQPFHTLSGGERQRLKLVTDLLVKTNEPTLYLLDEPSAGLHFEDIEKLIRILHRLVQQGHTVFLIEHHLDLLQQAQWIIELGPEGGPHGGQLIFEGTVKNLLKAATHTGKEMKANL